MSPRTVQSPRGMIVQAHAKAAVSSGTPAQPRGVVMAQQEEAQQMLSPRRVAGEANIVNAAGYVVAGGSFQDASSPRLAVAAVQAGHTNAPQHRDANRVVAMENGGWGSPRYVSGISAGYILSVSRTFHGVWLGGKLPMMHTHPKRWDI
jgi:hypothetical protein